MRTGWIMLIVSILTRMGVVILLCLLALMTEYLNLKQAYNNPRLVELSHGPKARAAYAAAEEFLGRFGDPLEVAQTNGGMTWSIRIMGVPFTDPVAALSVLAKNHRWNLGFALGLTVPLLLALLFGRVFCAYICPASLLFFAIARLRALLGRWFYFPQLTVNRGLAWGILVGGLLLAVITGHGVWSLLLPYFALGQTLFHGIAMGTLSIALGSLLLFAGLDFFLGRQFTCRYVCPTGRLLGWIGQRSVIAIGRDADACLEDCNRCAEVCPQGISPRLDQTTDCSLCGECLIDCPAQCLGLKPRLRPKPRVAPVLALLLMFSASPLFAHHFKGLPHYNYFENYPQVPEEEFLGQAGNYEMSLVIYDFQGIQREHVEDPENVRLFLVIFNLLDSKAYHGELTFEILDGDQTIHSERFSRAEQENLYSIQRQLPDTGNYSIRLILHEADNLECVIPFVLSTQKTHWGRWIALGLLALVTITAIGARKARLAMDRKEAHQRNLQSTETDL